VRMGVLGVKRRAESLACIGCPCIRSPPRHVPAWKRTGSTVNNCTGGVISLAGSPARMWMSRQAEFPSIRLRYLEKIDFNINKLLHG
jgi:hypothetical protein